MNVSIPRMPWVTMCFDIGARSNSHNIGLVHSSDLPPLVVPRELEGELRHTLGGLLGDQLDGLHHSVHDLVLDARVLSFGVLTDCDHVYVVV